MNYDNLNISEEDRKKEIQTIEKIKECIDNEKSWIFDSGAGAGKTYSLIETLKYIIVKNEQRLKFNNQKVICITYTNVAADEIKERLGNTQIVDVSTIHEYIWETISPYQQLLVKHHRNNLENIIKRCKNDLESVKEYGSLEQSEKDNIKNILGNNKKEYYKIKGSKKDELFDEVRKWGILNENVLKTKKAFINIADNLIKIDSYEKTISYINEEKIGYTQVKYDARFNYDRLDKMYISHDTLLEYANRILDKNDILKQIICDKNPFVLIDEYQDTAEEVVSFFNKILDYSKQLSHPFVLGYYGDTKQNIYEKGIGKNIYNYLLNFEYIKKEYNRRCSPEIINVANEIRNDSIKQKSIYSNFPKSEIIFYNINNSREDVIDYLCTRWKISKDNKLHCFELKNEIVAESSGFKEFYEFFKNSDYYKRSNYTRLSQETMSNDIKKLGPIQNLLYRILEFKYKLANENTLLSNILINYNYPYNTIKKMIDDMKGLNGENLKEYLQDFFDLRNSDKNIRKVIDSIFIEDIGSYDDLINYICNTLYKSDEEISQDKIDQVNSFLEMNISVYNNWYNFVNDISNENVEYHTYHSTKGKEFDNVVIFMNQSFGRSRISFSSLFENILETCEEDDEKTEKARNLLYVAVTRATKNLCIVYLDSLLQIQKSNLETIFNNIYTDLFLK